MLAIVNQGQENQAGETLYTVQVNQRILTVFWHRYENGLAACLDASAKAAKEYEDNGQKPPIHVKIVTVLVVDDNNRAHKVDMLEKEAEALEAFLIGLSTPTVADAQLTAWANDYSQFRSCWEKKLMEKA